MRSFLITYDLRSPGRDYTGLHAAIKATGRWWHYLESTWVVTTSTYETADAMFSALRHHFGQNDRLFITPIHASDDRQGWLTQDAWSWLKTNVAP